MDYSEKWGTSIDEAVKLALDDLKATEDEVEVIVLEQPSKGFFGIGSKLAKVRVEKKNTVDRKKEKPKEKKPVKEVIIKPKKEKKEKKEAPEVSVPSVDEKISEHEELSVAEVREENLEPVNDHIALDFLKEIAEKMDIAIDITAKKGDDVLFIEMNGKDAGTVIGKRGQTLDAIQYLTSLVVNKGKEDYTRVVIDAENYRSKREKTLEQLAHRLANKVIKNKRSVRLEPMNPYERKIIHATLQKNKYIVTRSEGSEPYRRVIIELKK